MTKPSIKAEFNTFVAGLVTEASPLNFPPNASADEENFVLNKDGTRKRRLGLKIEDYIDGALFTIGAPDLENLQVFQWRQPGGVLNLEVLVIRSGSTLYMFDMRSSPFKDGLLGSVDTGLPRSTRYSFASVNGFLVVAGGQAEFVAINYQDNVFSQRTLRVKTRDLWGVECYQVPQYETDVKFQGAFDDCHIYNLANQSWGIPRKNNAGVLVDPVSGYFGAYGRYPSNTQQVWVGLQYQPSVSGADPYERMYYNLFEDVEGSSPVISRGYFIIDAVERGSSRTTEFNYNLNVRYPALNGATAAWPEDRTDGGARVVTEFAGRAFFAGFPGKVINPDARSPNLANYVFFSQLVKSTADISACYQAGDPTSRDESDVVETDGGFVRVAGCDQIVGMLNLGSNLIIFATNGVWSLSGGSDYGFSATNFKLDKISSFGCFSQASIVEERGKAYYWSETGINVVSRNQFGDYEVGVITDNTISTYYQSIPSAAKAKASGVFDPVSKKISWLYNTGTWFTPSSGQMQLVLDLNLNAFSKMRVKNSPASRCEVITPFISSPFRTSLVENQVVSGVDTITVSTDQVVISSKELYSEYQSCKYLLLVKDVAGSLYSAYIGSFTENSFRDWEGVDGDGVDADAYLITGALTGGDSTVNKTLTYLTFHMARTETVVDATLTPLNQSSCKFRCHWGWTNSLDSGRWSAEQQAYRYSPVPVVTIPGQEYTNHSDVITTKHKVRGYGKSLAFSLQTEPGKDCRILGWGISLSGNSYV